MITSLHEYFHAQKRYTFPFKQVEKDIPRNGIYLLFEQGEKFQDYDRIVRVGTHTGNNQLRSRLNQHFVKENKNRSIFRKNIGRCLLNQTTPDYLPFWELDRTSKADKANNLALVNLAFERQVEGQISQYIQANLSFCVLRMDAKEARLFWERKLASTLAQSRQLPPSSQWLGHRSPKEKIVKYGLWQVNELAGEVLTSAEWEQLKKVTAIQGLSSHQ